jgi:bifunctional non-homologous end joining protein LigD
MHTHTSPSELSPVPFQLLARCSTLPSGPHWLFERKFDGYRAQIVSCGGAVRVFTRGGQDWTHRVPHIVAAAAALRADFILDGEICATASDGRTDLSWLSDPAAHSAQVVCYAFDVLKCDGNNLAHLPLNSRKSALTALLDHSDRAVLREVSFVRGFGESLLNETRQAGHEGIVAKRADLPYQAGRRSDSWLKFKNRKTDHFRVVGWQVNSDEEMTSLLVATTDEVPRYCGRVGTGFSISERRTLPAAFPPALHCPLPLLPPADACCETRWSDLTRIIEVEYLEFSSTGILREPSALRILSGRR